MRKIFNILAFIMITGSLIISCRTSNNDEDGNEAFEAGATAEGLKSEQMTLDDIASFINENEDLNNLAKVVKAVDLEEYLTNDTTMFTIFAPNDEAFDAMSQQDFEQFLESKDSAALNSLLKGHLILGNYSMNQLKNNNGSIETLNGSIVTIEENNGVRVNNANIVAADIETSNGTLHIIDGVLK